MYEHSSMIAQLSQQQVDENKEESESLMQIMKFDSIQKNSSTNEQSRFQQTVMKKRICLEIEIKTISPNEQVKTQLKKKKIKRIKKRNSKNKSKQRSHKNSAILRYITPKLKEILEKKKNQLNLEIQKQKDCLDLFKILQNQRIKLSNSVKYLDRVPNFQKLKAALGIINSNRNNNKLKQQTSFIRTMAKRYFESTQYLKNSLKGEMLFDNKLNLIRKSSIIQGLSIFPQIYNSFQEYRFSK